METATAEPTMGRKKSAPKPDVDVAKIQSDVMRDARIVVAVTGEGLSEYLSRLLRPLIAKDKAEAIARESGGKPKR